MVRAVRFAFFLACAWMMVTPALAETGQADGTAPAAVEAPASFITVNGTSIPIDVFQARVEHVPVKTVKGGKDVTIPAGQYVVEQMITEQLLQQLAERENVAATDDEVERKLQYLKSSTGGNFVAQLRAQGTSEQEWKRQMMLQQSVVNLLGKGSHVTDAAIRKAYNTELAKPASQFKKPGAVFISAIMTKGQDKINKAYKLLQDGQDFGTVAMQLSEDRQTAPRQGQVGWLSMNMAVVPMQIRKAAFGTGVGKYSKPMLVKDKKDNAWVILRVDNKRHATKDSYDSVKDLIREQLSVKSVNRKAFDKLLQDFIGESKIEVNAERYKSIPDMMKKSAGVGESLDNLVKPPAH